MVSFVSFIMYTIIGELLGNVKNFLWLIFEQAAPIIPHKTRFVNTYANKNICFCNDWSDMQGCPKAPKNGQVGADCSIGCAIKCKTEVKK